jgi:hypothetical protein
MMDIDREALEGICGTFQLAYKFVVYFANFHHILFLSELTSCTIILVHHVLPHVVVLQECPIRDGWDLFQWEPMSRLRLVTLYHTWWYHMRVM